MASERGKLAYSTGRGRRGHGTMKAKKSDFLRKISLFFLIFPPMHRTAPWRTEDRTESCTRAPLTTTVSNQLTR